MWRVLVERQLWRHSGDTTLLNTILPLVIIPGCFISLSPQRHPLRGILSKRCSENMHQTCRRAPCRSAISIKLLWNFIEIALWHECSPVNLLHIFRTSFCKNTYEGLPLPPESINKALVFCPLKVSTKLWLSDIFRVCRIGALA